MNKEKLDVLIHEHSIINSKIDDFIKNQFIYISAILTFASGFIFVSINQQALNATILYTIQFFPYFFILVGPTFMYKFNRAIILHGYRCFIEEKINKEVGKNVSIGAFLVKEKLLDKNPFAIMNYITMLALILTSVFFCHKNQISYKNIHLIIQLLAIITGMIIFILQNNKAFINGYNFGKDNYDSKHKLIQNKSIVNHD